MCRRSTKAKVVYNATAPSSLANLSTIAIVSTEEQTTGLVSLVEAINNVSVNSRRPPISEKELLDEPPSYERATGYKQLSPQIQPPVTSNLVNQSSSVSQPGQSSAITQSIAMLQESMTAYRNGPKHSKWAQKRAARNVVEDLCGVEASRRIAKHGRLRCGERKQIKRELKPLQETFQRLTV